jgi:competence protein ComEC
MLAPGRLVAIESNPGIITDLGSLRAEILGRPLLVAAMFLGVGMVWAPSFGQLDSMRVTGFAFLVLGLLGICLGQRGLGLSFLMGAGLFVGAWKAQGLERSLITPGFERFSVYKLQGRVTEDLGLNREDMRASVLIEEVSFIREARGSSEIFAGKIKLTFEAPKNYHGVKPGSFVRVAASLRFPLPPSNPGEFDYRHYCLVRGIAGLASARFGESLEIIQGTGGSWSGLAWSVRRACIEGLAKVVPQDTAALAAGVAFGDKRGLSKREIESYGRSGLSYLLAVAGLHLHMALALFIALARLVTPRRKHQAWIALLGVSAYVVAAGFPVPALRAFALVLLMLLGQALDLESDPLNSLAFGFLLVLWFEPWALGEAGFQLSFLVTASIMAFVRPWQKALQERGWPKFLAELAAVVLAVQLACIPLEAWYFRQFTYPAIFSDLAALPLLAPIIGLSLSVTMLQFAHPILAWPLGWLLQGLCTALTWSNDLFAGLPYAALSVGRPSSVWMALWGIGILGLLGGVWLKWGSCAIVCTCLLSLCCMALVVPGLPGVHRHIGRTQVWMLDCGQGDSFLFEFGDGRTLLVDGGPGRPDAGSWVVQPALRALKISRLDGVVFTHADADHLGGLQWILDQFPVKRVFESGLARAGDEPNAQQWDGALLDSVRKVIKQKKITVQAVRAGQNLPGFSEVEVLWPPKELPVFGKRKDRNDTSLVMNIEGWLLMAGDLTRRAEKTMLSEGKAPKGIQVLKIGHHGSRGSSSAAFLSAIHPEWALISAGRANRFKFPHSEVLERLQSRSATVLRTDQLGCIRLDHDLEGRLRFEAVR